MKNVDRRLFNRLYCYKKKQRIWRNKNKKVFYPSEKHIELRSNKNNKERNMKIIKKNFNRNGLEMSKLDQKMRFKK